MNGHSVNGGNTKVGTLNGADISAIVISRTDISALGREGLINEQGFKLKHGNISKHFNSTLVFFVGDTRASGIVGGF